MTMDFDLGNMSHDELVALRNAIDKAMVKAENRGRAKALAALSQAAKEHGFKLEDLLAQANAPRKTRTTKPAKRRYIHPDNPSFTWTGRGRKPSWYLEMEEKGDADRIIVERLDE